MISGFGASTRLAVTANHWVANKKLSTRWVFDLGSHENLNKLEQPMDML